LLVTDRFVGGVMAGELPAAFLQPTLFTAFFLIFYVVVMALSWVNFIRAYRRTTTTTSRRRMAYLILGALAPTFGSFPFLLFGSGFVAQHPLVFWSLAAVSNLLVGGLIIVMAYSVAFFGVSWPDRVVKSRLFKWILRGPVIASFTLGLVTIVRRLGEAFGSGYTALVPITMVISILMGQYVITLFSPLWDRMFFFGDDRRELHLLRNLEARLLTHNDLQQFIEMVLAAVRDRLQAPGAYLAALDSDQLELVITNGNADFSSDGVSEQLSRLVSENGGLPQLFRWGDDYLVPLRNPVDEDEWELIGLLGVAGVGDKPLDSDAIQDLTLLAGRATLALRDRRMQQQVMASLRALTPHIDVIQRFRAAGRYDGQRLLDEEAPDDLDISQWVKEALTHYWGGPKLTESPLLALRVVQQALDEHNGNSANALRSILKQAVERVRPEGERRFTAEWVLYNILDMKFLEGRKVREVALRLAVSEADLYRKQRIAIEEVAKAILDMETHARDRTLESVQS
jgi:hypothetical protein